MKMRNPRFASGYDGATNSYEYYYREKDSVIGRLYKQNRADFSSFLLEGLIQKNPDHLLVIAHNGNDKLGLWSFDPKEKKFKELIYRRSDGDVFGTYVSFK